MKKYEITYLTLQEEDHNATTVSGLLSEAGAKIVSVHPWTGRRKLAFPINKQDQAFYTTIIFEAETSAVAPLERALNLHDGVLRSIIVVHEPGIFDRIETREETTELKEAKPTAVATEETVEDVAPAEAEAPTEAVAEKPKRARAKKEATVEDTKALDEKIDELLKEDITK